jgi:hypothetical protein
MQKNSNKKSRLIFIIFIAILIPAIWFFFLNKKTDHDIATKVLTGSWIRDDGGYTLQIIEVKDDGILDVVYLNPKPIHVGQAEWRIEKDILQIFVELKDENYPGSLYQLTYDKKQKVLFGTYYQAVDELTYEVYFTKKK